MLKHPFFPLNEKHSLAPEISVSKWLNTNKDLSLKKLKGKVVFVHAFQMLCPGCVSHSIPQAATLSNLFSDDDFQVIGLHSVFEHHHAMGAESLEVFVHEYHMRYPIAVDRPSEKSNAPETMQKYQMQGTPTTLLIDKTGHLRLHHFGPMPDSKIAAYIGGLLVEDTSNHEMIKNVETCKTK